MNQQVSAHVTPLIEGFDRRVQATPTDRWAHPSPCERWTAKDVVDHVISNFVGICNGLGAGDSSPQDSEDIVSRWNAARDRFLRAVETADLSTQLPGPMGPMSAIDVIGRLIATDVLVHTWDLARAVGGDEQLDEEAVRFAYSALAPLDQMIRVAGVFGPRIDVGDDADLQTQFLSFLGRKV